MAVMIVLLGTWPVVLAVLERRGRLPQHRSLDFSITNFLAAVLIALTFGQIGLDTLEMPNFLTQLTQAVLIIHIRVWLRNFNIEDSSW